MIMIAAVIILLAIVPYSRNKIRIAFSYIFYPAIHAISSSSLATTGLFHGLSEISEIKKANQLLTEKLTNAQIDKNELNELKIENETLKKQLGFIETHENRELIPARIISRDPVSYMDYIVVDKGTKEGINAGMPVISVGALVGKVVEASAMSSKVTLITSKNSIIQAMLQDSREQGILRGGLSGLALSNIPQEVIAKQGSMVITSGLGGDIEQGLMIGTISSTTSGSADIFKTLSIQPTVDFTKLELVFVLK